MVHPLPGERLLGEVCSPEESVAAYLVLTYTHRNTSTQQLNHYAWHADICCLTSQPGCYDALGLDQLIHAVSRASSFMLWV